MNYRIFPITSGPKHHFFGYYDMEPWDPTGRYHLVLEVDFMDRQPTADDVAAVCMVDLKDGNKLIPLAKTSAWNFQQGAMLQWLDADNIMFNDRRGGKYVCVRHNIGTGRQTVLGPASADLSQNHRLSACLNFSRVQVCRPGYGYLGIEDPFAAENHTDRDGLGILDLKTGEHKLVFTFADINRLVAGQHGDQKMYFNHVLFNPSGKRLSIIVRWAQPGGWFISQMWTVGVDGSSPVKVLNGPKMGHFDWKDDETLIAFTSINDVDGIYEFDALGRTPPRLLWDRVDKRNGHVAFSHNRRWVCNDTYPDANGNRSLSLIEYATGEELPLGTYYSPWKDGLHDIRCDFHPSFSADDSQLAIDGMHEGTRQRYIVEIE